MRELTRTLLSLHADGEMDISAPMLAKAHRAKGYTISIAETVERLEEVVVDIRDESKEHRVHLFTLEYFEARRPVVFSLPTDQWEWALWSVDCSDTRLAKSYLPIFRPCYGIRFATENDFLLMVYRYHTMFTTAKKAEHQTSSLMNDVRVGCLPQGVVISIIRRLAGGIVKGIDGKRNLPASFKRQAAKLQQGIAELIRNDLEKEWFEKNRYYDERDPETKHDPNYDPGFKKGYGYK